jgi:hypothetical protein
MDIDVDNYNDMDIDINMDMDMNMEQGLGMERARALTWTLSNVYLKEIFFVVCHGPCTIYIHLKFMNFNIAKFLVFRKLEFCKISQNFSQILRNKKS